MSGCAKYRIDSQVRELCAQDGGIRVYETVTLPPDKFLEGGDINFFYPTRGENALGEEYVYYSDKTEYIKREPRGDLFELQMSRYHTKVFRRVDRKLLGELVVYGRSGGDVPGWWHPSSFYMPKKPKSRVF